MNVPNQIKEAPRGSSNIPTAFRRQPPKTRQDHSRRPFWFEAENSPWAYVRETLRVSSARPIPVRSARAGNRDLATHLQKRSIKNDPESSAGLPARWPWIGLAPSHRRTKLVDRRATARDVQHGTLFAIALKYSGHATRDRHERFRERDHLDELGD